MLENRLTAVIVFSILALVFAGRFYQSCVVKPSREANRAAERLDSARSYYLQQQVTRPPASFAGLPLAQQLHLRYMVQGDEQAKQQLMNHARDRAREKYRRATVVNLVIACICALVAVGAGLTMRQPRSPQKTG